MYLLAHSSSHVVVVVDMRSKEFKTSRSILMLILCVPLSACTRAAMTDSANFLTRLCACVLLCACLLLADHVLYFSIPHACCCHYCSLLLLCCCCCVTCLLLSLLFRRQKTREKICTYSYTHLYLYLLL